MGRPPPPEAGTPGPEGRRRRGRRLQVPRNATRGGRPAQLRKRKRAAGGPGAEGLKLPRDLSEAANHGASEDSSAGGRPPAAAGGDPGKVPSLRRLARRSRPNSPAAPAPTPPPFPQCSAAELQPSPSLALGPPPAVTPALHARHPLPPPVRGPTGRPLQAPQLGLRWGGGSGGRAKEAKPEPPPQPELAPRRRLLPPPAVSSPRPRAGSGEARAGGPPAGSRRGLRLDAQAARRRPRPPENKMTNEEPLPKKVRLSETDFKVMARDELILRWKQYEAYVQALEGKYTDLNSNDVTGLRESEEKLKQQQQESARRENILVMRLATKEQEMQECTTQIQYLKQVQQPSVAQLRSTMVDPAINLFFLKMKGELEQTKDKLEQAQNELSAWKFTPDSQTGKKLMAKCRMLIQENQELGRQLSQGRIAQLEAELALQKKYSEELKSSQDELNDFIIQLDEEVEGMQSTILVLQQQLKETRQQLAQYQQQSQASVPGTSRTPSSEPLDQGEVMGKDCSRLANGPSNGSSSHQRTSGPGFFREGNTTEDDFPSSPGNGNKVSNNSEERTGRGGSSYINQLSTGYESVDSPTGSENSLTHHSNDTDSNHDPQEEKAVTGKGNRTVGSRHVQNGLDSSVNVQGSVL